MDWDQLKSFYYIATLGGISKAAQVVHRSQPAVSRQLRALEESLGSTLFERKGRQKFILTPAGRRLLSFADDVLFRHRELLTDLESINLGGDCHVHVSAPAATMGLMLAEPVRLFRDKYPKTKLVMLERPPGVGLELLREGKVDLTHAMASQVPSQFRAHVWLPGRFVLLVPKEHPLSRVRKPTLTQIAGYPFIKLNSNVRFASAHKVDQAIFDTGLQLQVFLESGNIYVAAEYIRRGLGVGIVFAPENGLDLFPGQIDLVNLDHIFPPDTAVVCSRKDPLSPMAGRFLEHMLEWSRSLGLQV